MRAVITVVGKDVVGILHKVTGICAENDVNVSEVSQTVLQDMFCMIMFGDMDKCAISLSDFSDKMTALGEQQGLSIHVMHEDVFDSMHRV